MVRGVTGAGLVALVVASAMLGGPTTTTEAMQPASATHRRLLWSDEFNRPVGTLPDPRKWTMERGGLGWGQHELQAYLRGRPANASQDGKGHLRITARKESLPGTGGARYTSARLTTEGHFSFTRGRVEARIKLPYGKGLFSAFWTMGDYTRYRWPGAGEIDVMEAINYAPWVEGVLHMPSNEPGGWAYGTFAPRIGRSYAAAFHVYAMEWTASYVQWFVDGRSIGTVWKAHRPAGSSWVLDSRPQHLILNLAVGGTWAGPPNAATRFPRTMLVDWVRVYR